MGGAAQGRGGRAGRGNGGACRACVACMRKHVHLPRRQNTSHPSRLDSYARSIRSSSVARLQNGQRQSGSATWPWRMPRSGARSWCLTLASAGTDLRLAWLFLTPAGRAHVMLCQWRRNFCLPVYNQDVIAVHDLCNSAQRGRDRPSGAGLHMEDRCARNKRRRATPTARQTGRLLVLLKVSQQAHVLIARGVLNVLELLTEPRSKTVSCGARA